MKQMAPISACSYVEQKPYLFEATLRENLLVGRTGILDKELWRAIEGVGLNTIFRNRQGLDSMVSDQGSNLSEGQTYRVGIARALIRCRPFLLLDEPFASLDPDSVRALTRTLQALGKTCGILVVTHQVPKDFAFHQTFSVSFSTPSPMAEKWSQTFLNPPGEERQAFAGGLSITPVDSKERNYVQ